MGSSVAKTVGAIALGAVAIALTGGAAAGFVAAFGATGGAVAQSALLVGLATGAGAISKSLTRESTPQLNSTTDRRLSKSLFPEEHRKIVFGHTAAPMDVRYWEVHGPDNTKYDEVIAIATHKIHSFEKFFLDGVERTFTATIDDGDLGNSFSRVTRVEGVAGSQLVTIGAGTLWNPAGADIGSFTGCAHMALRLIYDEEKYPRGFPTKYIQEVKGALVYDPRKDGSIPGGTGSHRANNQLTWKYTDGTDIGRNPVLQELWYRLGWKNSGVLVAGMGIPVDDIDMASYQQAATDCETLGFEGDCALSTGDSHETNLSVIRAACGGVSIDTGGLYSFHVPINDLSSSTAFGEDDVVGPYEWNPKLKMRDQYNEIGGTFVEPAALYQRRSYPVVTNATFKTDDGFTRRRNIDYASVQDGNQVQILSGIALNRTRFQGAFKAAFSYKAMLVKNWSVIDFTFPKLGFVAKKFRVIEQSITTDGLIIMTLREEDASIYTAITPTTLPGPPTGTSYEPRASIPVTGLVVTNTSISGGANDVTDSFNVTWTAPSAAVQRTEVEYRKEVDTVYSSAGIVGPGDNDLVIPRVASTTTYRIRVRHVNISNVPGAYTEVIKSSSALAVSRDTGLVNNVAAATVQGNAQTGFELTTSNSTVNHISSLANVPFLMDEAVFQDQGNGTARTLSRANKTFTIQDGGSKTWNPAFQTVPTVFLSSGVTSAASSLSSTVDHYTVLQATGLTTTNFTASVKIFEVTGTTTSQVDTVDAAGGAGGPTNPERVMNKTQAADVANNYDMVWGVDIKANSGDGPTFVTLEFWANDGGGFDSVGTASVNTSSTSFVAKGGTKNFTKAGLDTNDDVGLDVKTQTDGTYQNLDIVSLSYDFGTPPASVTGTPGSINVQARAVDGEEEIF